MLEQDYIIQIYKDILNGKRKRFPRFFWNDNEKEKARIVVKYLFEEILKWNPEKIISDLTYEIISKYKITTIYSKIYNNNIGTLVKGIYPEAIKGNRLPVSKETCKKLSIAHKNLSKEKRDNIKKGMNENRYCIEYAKKLSDTKLGESNPQHKLKSDQVKEIRKLWGTQIYSVTVLGEMFGVKRQTISDIIYNRTWKHL